MNDRPLDRPATDSRADDALIGGFVRELAEEWTMPPQRLGAPTWRDRVGARGGARGRRAAWARRFARAAASAIVATIALSLVAVWLTIPRANGPSVGSSAAPATGSAAAPGSPATPRPTPRPTASPFPQLTVYGAPLPQTRLLVGVGPDYRVLDMGSGQLGEAVASSDMAANEIVFHDGRGLCLCGGYSVVNGVDHLALEIRTIGADGSVERVQPVGAYEGWARGVLPGAYARATLTPDGNTFVVGWTVRELSAWRSGIDLVDVATGRLTRAAMLPDLPLVADGTVGRAGQTPNTSGADVDPFAPKIAISGADVYPFAPKIAMSPDGLRLMATQYVSISGEIAAVYRFSGEIDVDGGPIRVAPAASGPGTLDAADCFSFPDERFASNDVYTGLCSNDGSVVLRRVAPDGQPLGDTDLAALGAGGFGFFGNASVIDPSSAVAYYWNAFNRTVVKVDLPSGRILAQATLPDQTAFAQPFGPLGAAVRALASWLAPTALAKLYLDPAVALSPDRSRLYLLGTDATSPADGSAGSSGVWVVDSATLGVIDHWQPTADFVSLAVSRDGAFVYAAGLPEVGADGNDAPHGASVTVFDAADGTVRALAGQLGRDWLWIRGVLAP